MNGRSLCLLVCCASAFAQLPRPEAPMPGSVPATRDREGEAPALAHVDAVIYDLHNAPVAGLTAADFTLETDGKGQDIVRCAYRTGEPLRLAVVIDDLSLSLENLISARDALRQFVAKELRPGDEMAILRAGAGTGALDRFTSDKGALALAINRAQYNPAAEGAPPGAFTAGSVGALRAVLEGLREIPGRKAVLFVSERLREASRNNAPGAEVQLEKLAHGGSAVFYAVDMAPQPENPYQLDVGLAGAAKETGGFIAGRGELGNALTRIAQDQAGYYDLAFRPEGPGFDYITGAPRAGRVAVKTNRKDTVLRARSSAFPAGEHAEYEGELKRALGRELVSGGIRVKLTPLVTMDRAWQVDGVLHIEARDITFVKGLDGRYRAAVEVGIALYGDSAAPLHNAVQTLELVFGEDDFRQVQAGGFGHDVVLPAPVPGCYQLRAVVQDAATGRIGSAHQLLRVADASGGKLVMSSVVLRGAVEKTAGGGEISKDPAESGPIRRFQAGHRLTYGYQLFNVAADAEKRSAVEVRTEILRDGVAVFRGEPVSIAFTPEPEPGRRAVRGTVALNEQTAPGYYVFRVTVTDKLSARTVAEFMDFEVRP